MTNEERPENTSRSPSSLSSDGVDELNKPLIRYKRNPRVLSSNEEVKSSEPPAKDGENRITSSTSSFIKAAKDDKPEIIPFKKRPSFIIYHNDDHPPQTPQLTTRESGCKLSADEEQGVEKKTGDENLVVDDDISTKINDDDGDNKTTETTHQGGNEIAPTTTVVDDGKEALDINIVDTSVEKNDGNNEAEQVQDVAMKDVVDESKEEQKQVGYFVSLMMDDGDDVPDQLMEIKDNNGGDNGCLTNDDGKNGGNGDEEGEQAPMEDDHGGHGNNISNNKTPGSGEDKSEGKKPMEIDVPVIIHEGGSSKNSKLNEGGDGAEQEQVRPIDVVMEPEGGGEKGKEIADANRSTNDEQGEVGQEEEEEEDDDDLGQKARKRLRISGSDEIIGSNNAVVLGPNGGIGRDEPQVRPPAVQQQAATRTIRLFGFDINPCDQQEHHVPIIIINSGRRSGSNQAMGGESAATGGAAAGGDGSPPMMHRAVMLFGVDISGGQEQPAAAMGNGEGGSNSNHQPGSDGGDGR